MDIALRSPMADEQVDEILRGLIGILETALPGRVRAYYLSGSYSDGTAVGHDRSLNASDLDVFVIVRGTLALAEAETFQQIVEGCRLISPLTLDAHAYSEHDLLQAPGMESSQLRFLNALIQVGSVLLYGDDLRSALPDVPFSRYVLDVIESGVYHLGISQQTVSLAYPLVKPLAFPLGYPDPHGEFYGYDAIPARPDAPRGARVLVDAAAWIATLILALETGRYATRKSQTIQLCKQYLPGDARIQLATAIYDVCKGEWAYGLPQRAEDREQLRAWCHDMLDLENMYLGLCKDFLLDQLRHGDAGEKRQAASILRSVVYRDDELFSALTALTRDAHEAVRSAATKAQAIAGSGQTMQGEHTDTAGPV